MVYLSVNVGLADGSILQIELRLLQRILHKAGGGRERERERQRVREHTLPDPHSVPTTHST